MKIKDGFLLREVAGNYIVVPVGDVAFNAMITLNESGVLIWKTLENGCNKEDLVNALLSEYEISKENAEKDVDLFLEKLAESGILENE